MATLREVKDGQTFVISESILYRAIRACPETITAQILGRVIDGNPDVYPTSAMAILSRFGRVSNQVEILSDEQLMVWRLAGYDL